MIECASLKATKPICHGLFDRVPNLKVATLELGAAWAPELVRRFKIAYGKTPQLFGQDPVQAFHDHVWVAPFYEDRIELVAETLGEDRILLGSDFPHPEGLDQPKTWAGDFASLGEAPLRKIMRDNLKNLVGH